MRSARSRGASLVVLAALCGAATAWPAQAPRGPGLNEGFAHLAEGYTSARAGGPIEAGYRMFSVPDFGAICARARAGDVASLRASNARISARTGVPLSYARLRIDALDAGGGVVPRVPIAIESEIGSGVLDVRQDHIGGDNVTPKEPGTIKHRVRTICDAPGGETFVTVIVAR